MLLRSIESSPGPVARSIIGTIRLVSPRTPVDIVRAFAYRPEILGKPFCAFCDALLRGRSDWSQGEREMLGGFVSNLNRCTHCATSHCEVASLMLGKSRVRAVLEEDWSRESNGKVQALLGFARTLTLAPEDLVPRDIEALRAVPLREAAILDGALIVTGFNFINRVASALHFEGSSSRDILPTAWFLRSFGYRVLASLLSRRRAAGSRAQGPADEIRAARGDRARLVNAAKNWLEPLCSLDPSGRHRRRDISLEVFRKVQHEPNSVTNADAGSLRRIGYSDDDIFDLIVAAAAAAALMRLDLALRAVGAKPPGPTGCALAQGRQSTDVTAN